MPKFLRVNMPDAYYDIPIEVIALSRATHYADEYGDDVARSLAEDTLPFFDDAPYEVAEFAINNMNWSDVEPYAVRVEKPPIRINREEEWMSCDKRVIDK